jgi:hypothetical protein
MTGFVALLGNNRYLDQSICNHSRAVPFVCAAFGEHDDHPPVWNKAAQVGGLPLLMISSRRAHLGWSSVAHGMPATLHLERVTCGGSANGGP